jgi:hypothetical protein
VCGLSGEKLDDGKAIYRLVHETDIVPSLPLVVMGYWPFVGQLVYITAGNKVVTGMAAYLRRIAGQALPLITKSFAGLPALIGNHFIRAYIDALLIIADKAKYEEAGHGEQGAAETGDGEAVGAEGTAGADQE